MAQKKKKSTPEPAAPIEATILREIAEPGEYVPEPVAAYMRVRGPVQVVPRVRCPNQACATNQPGPGDKLPAPRVRKHGRAPDSSIQYYQCQVCMHGRKLTTFSVLVLEPDEFRARRAPKSSTLPTR